MINNIHDSKIYNSVAVNNQALDRVIKTWELIHEQSVDLTLPYQNLVTHKLMTANINLEVLFGKLPEVIWNSLAFDGHELYSYEDGKAIFLEKINQSLEFIDEFFYKTHGYLFPFLQLILPVKISNGSSEKLVTSITIPDLPFASFISKNAMIHLAPKIINYGYEKYFLAENIFHEMTHNMVNIEILENDLFIDDYSSNTSPKIEIEWRKDAQPRNRFWELDRALHALHVYSNLYHFRMECVIQGQHTGITADMISQAHGHGKLLYIKLMEFKQYLTPNGIEYANYANQKFTKNN